MPSLSALREFKTSFDNIGHEKAVLAERDLPFTEMELPETEAEPMETGPEETPFPDIDPSVAAALGLGAGPSETGTTGGDEFGSPDFSADFSDLLGGVPDDLPPPAETPDDFNVPGGLLNGLSGELEAASPDFPPLEAAPGLGDNGLDLGDDGLDLGGESLDLGGDGLDLGGGSPDSGGDGLDLGGESPDSGGDELDLGDDSFDLGGESPDSGDDELDLGGDGLDLGGDGFDLGSEGPDFGGDSLDLGGEGFDLGGESLNSGDGGLDLGGDGLDLGGESADLGSDGLDLGGEGFDLGGESLDSGGGGLDLGGDGLDLGGESPDSGGDSLDLGGEGFDLGGESLDSGGGGLDLGGDGLDLGGESPDSGGDGLDLGGESLDLGGDSLDLGGDSLDLGGDGLDLGGDGLDLGGESPDSGGDGLDLGDEGTDLGGDSLDLGGEGFDLGGEGPDSGGDELDLGGDGFDLGGEGADLGSDGLDLGGDGLDLGGEGADLGGEGFDLGGEGFDLGGDTGAEDGGPDNLDSSGFTASAGDEDSSFDPLSGDDLDPGGAGAPAGDAFDAFSFDGEQPGTDSDAETDASSSGDEFGDVDFSLDDLIPDPAKSAAAAAAPKTKGRPRAKAKAKAKAEKAPEEVEEIQLNDEDLERFQKTLSGYPLNLRVACGELIAEQAVAPEQMSKLIRLLVNGAPAKETAALAGQILGKTIEIPKGFEKSTGEALEAEQASFAYIFTHNFLPVLRLFALIAVGLVSLGYLAYTFIYTPLRAESIYKIGYERIFAGEFERANERFTEAFTIQRKKDWFYRYAEAFRDERQFLKAEEKYDELLRYYPRDKKGVLDYAALETYYLFNYQKANNLLQRELLDYAPDDFEGLLAFGDNNLAWGEIDPSKYDDARFAYARVLDKYGWSDPVVERMMKYFIRTDNLKEVLPLQAWFMNNPKRKLSAASLAELGGYLLDKRLEETRGVPNEYAERIEGIRDLLLTAVKEDPYLPEAHYHLARYYQSLDNARDERITLEAAIWAFDNAKEETVRRLSYRIDAHRRYAELLINSREFKPAEEQLVRGINLYEDALGRRLMSRSPDYGRLYAGLGDLEYFTKTGNMEMALNYYHRSEQNGWAPPEMQYRMGAAYYQREDWRNALEYLFAASSSLPLNRRMLFALGNAALKRGDYFAAQGYYNRLLDILETQRARLPVLLPNDRPEYLELAERLMMARNNAGVTYEALAGQTGDRRYRTRAQALYAEANRAWDARTRDPRTMIRSGSIPLPYLNSRNTLYPQPEYEPQIFIRIDRDPLEPSRWEELAPVGGLE